jgi:hypothetical protein
MQAQQIFSPSSSTDWPCGLHSLLHNGYRGLFPKDKAPVSEADLSHVSSDEIQNLLSYASIRLQLFMA